MSQQVDAELSIRLGDPVRAVALRRLLGRVEEIAEHGPGLVVQHALGVDPALLLDEDRARAAEHVEPRRIELEREAQRRQRPVDLPQLAMDHLRQGDEQIRLVLVVRDRDRAVQEGRRLTEATGVRADGAKTVQRVDRVRVEREDSAKMRLRLAIVAELLVPEESGGKHHPKPDLALRRTLGTQRVQRGEVDPPLGFDQLRFDRAEGGFIQDPVRVERLEEVDAPTIRPRWWPRFGGDAGHHGLLAGRADLWFGHRTGR